MVKTVISPLARRSSRSSLSGALRRSRGAPTAVGMARRNAASTVRSAGRSGESGSFRGQVQSLPMRSVSHNFPAHAEIVIVGGGIAGSSLAYHLTGLGRTDVVLLERGRLTVRHHLACGPGSSCSYAAPTP